MNKNDGIEVVVVTRHKGTIDYLKERGVIDGTEPFIEHAAADDVRLKHVVGMLPYHLAALTWDITVVDLEVPPEMRGVELDLEAVRRYAVRVATYSVLECLS